MSRILLGLASLNGALLLLAFTLGFISEGRANLSPNQPLSSPQELFTWHLITGLSTAILTLLVHSIVFTYFIGTGRWIQEVVKAYRLPVTLFETTRTLKLRALPCIVGSIVLVGTTAILGAATDRGMLDSTLHLAIATLAIAFNFWSTYQEYHLVLRNGGLIDMIMKEVTRMRQAQGLTTFPER
jgi:hypothetical protein